MKRHQCLFVKYDRREQTVCKSRRLTIEKMYSNQCTMYDLSSGLQVDSNHFQVEAIKISRLCRQGAKVMSGDVARRYNGGEHSAYTSVNQARLISSSMSWRAIKANGTVINKDFSDVIVFSAASNQNQFKTTEEVKAHDECRLLKSIIPLKHCGRWNHSCGRQVWGTRMHKSVQYSEYNTGKKGTDTDLSNQNYLRISLI